MEIIIRSRRGGKTTEMIKRMKQDPGMVAVCISMMEADRLSRENPDIDRARFLTASQAQQVLFGRDVSLFIDNADMFLQSLFRREIKAASFTED